VTIEGEGPVVFGQGLEEQALEIIDARGMRMTASPTSRWSTSPRPSSDIGSGPVEVNTSTGVAALPPPPLVIT
jgi:hypothetical protein